VPTGRRVSVDLFMPVWTPGSYLVREYSRNVEAVEAHAGSVRLAVAKTAKNRWRVQTNGASSVTVRYRVYGREMSVRNNFIDADFALLNGAATFLSLAGDAAPRPHEVVVELPAACWRHSVLTVSVSITLGTLRTGSWTTATPRSGRSRSVCEKPPRSPARRTCGSLSGSEE